MGISPAEAKRMSMWELAAVTERWIEAHDVEGARGRLNAEEKDELWEWVQAKGRPLTLKEARKKANGAGTGQAKATPGR
jgi:hypothetical protein